MNRQDHKGLAATPEWYQALYGAVTDAIYVFPLREDGSPGKFIEVNGHACTMLGYSQGEFLTMKVGQIEAPESKVDVREIISKMKPTQDVLFEQIHVSSGGRRIPVEIHAQLFHFQEKLAVLSVVRDISDRKRAEGQLRQREEMMRYIVKHDPNAIAVYDNNLQYLAVSNRCLKDYNVKEADIIGKHHYEVFPEMPQKWKDVHQRCLAGAVERSDDDYFERPDGSVTHNRWECRPWYQGNGEIGGIITYTEVTTERKRAEEALRESEERYRRLVENAPVGIISLDRFGQILDVNKNLLTIIGSPSKEATQRINMFDFQPLIEAGIAANFRHCLETGETAIYETPYRSKWGKELSLRYNLTPIRDRDGQVAGVQGILEDVSEQKRLEEQLLKSQKIEAIGTLAGGIAHDFNNILAAILGYAELANLDIPDSSPAKTRVRECIQATNRAKELIQQILAFSRQGKQEPRPLEIRALIREGLKMLRASLPSTIQIREMMDENLGLVEADPTQIHQVLINLCTNSAHAMREKGGILQISLERVDLLGKERAVMMGAKPGSYLKLTIQDTGHGMTPEVLGRLFDPYFTTKEIGRGTGLGLSVVHGIVQSHRGFIQVASEEGKGTTIEVFLPRLEGSVAVSQKRNPEMLPLGGKERVLLVADEVPIVTIGKMALERLGYTVETRTASKEALEVFRARSGEFDLVITDMTMPEMTGDELAREILRIRPEMPVILCTGYSERISEETAKAMGIREFVMKPLVLGDLARTIRKALDPQKGGKKKG